MRMQVHEHGVEVHIELVGVNGRQARVLEALTQYAQSVGLGDVATHPGAQATIAARARGAQMHVRMFAHDGRKLDTEGIYDCLRAALLQPRPRA